MRRKGGLCRPPISQWRSGVSSSVCLKARVPHSAHAVPPTVSNFKNQKRIKAVQFHSTDTITNPIEGKERGGVKSAEKSHNPPHTCRQIPYFQSGNTIILESSPTLLVCTCPGYMHRTLACGKVKILGTELGRADSTIAPGPPRRWAEMLGSERHWKKLESPQKKYPFISS